MENQKIKFALAGQIISKPTCQGWALAALFALVLGASVNLDGPSDHEANLMVAAAVADLEANK